MAAHHLGETSLELIGVNHVWVGEAIRTAIEVASHAEARYYGETAEGSGHLGREIHCRQHVGGKPWKGGDTVVLSLYPSILSLQHQTRAEGMHVIHAKIVIWDVERS